MQSVGFRMIGSLGLPLVDWSPGLAPLLQLLEVTEFIES